VSPEPNLQPPDDRQPRRDGAGVVVVTDSTTYVPAAMLAGGGVRVVSLYVGWDGDLKREDSYDDLDAFYERLASSPRLPTTSQPSVGDFLDCYRPAVDDGHDVVSIHIAEGLSGTCESAREAARVLAEEGHAGRVEVVDGETGAGGLGCLVLTAAEAAAAGGSSEEVVSAVHDAHEKLDIWFCLDTLEYLRKGGRIGAAQALVGQALQIKPILTFGSEIFPIGRVRTHRRALARMEEYLGELKSRHSTDWIVQHAQSADDAAFLVERGTEIIGTEPLFCTEVGPVLGAHLGSGLLVGGLSSEPA
jgi:DegV family protein with EDD domain